MKRLRKYLAFSTLGFLFCIGCSDSTPYIPGYIEGEYVYVSSGVTGTITHLNAERGQPITQNELAYTMDPEPEKTNIELSHKSIADLQNQVELAKTQLQRLTALRIKNVASQSAVDQAQTDYRNKAQQLAANQALLVRTEWGLQQKTKRAPISGLVFNTFYREGETVPENHPVFAILAPQYIKVLFYIPEGLLSQIKLGQVIQFNCDGCPAQTNATITYISPEAEYTPPVIYSKDTRYKLVYLVRADMPENIAKNFHPGQPIDVYLHP